MSVGRGSIPAMSTSAAEYGWFDRIRAMYCMTYVKGLTPSEFLARVGVTPYPDQDGLSSLYSTHWTDPLDIDNHWRFIGATQVQGDGGPWTLAIESNGWIGESDEYMSPASAGTQVLSHYQNASGRTSFNWWEDGELRTTFEFPHSRRGSTPDDLVEAMRRVGFDVSPEGESPGQLAKLALAEELSGVRVTAGLLANSSYACGYFGELPAVYRNDGKVSAPRPEPEVCPPRIESRVSDEQSQVPSPEGLGRGLRSLGPRPPGLDQES
ncbi:DUF6461 domain-containing protein [Streptomyces niveus]|uniref:DUF6461 domain-containing protein n=2 Tax=Streptomyces niveus TaxID=193462 RepID=UPI003692BCA3